jgi:hypothetical protein
LPLTVGHKRSAEIRSRNYQFKTKVDMKNKTSILVGTRHFFYALLATVLFSSCGGSTDKEACLSNVKEMFPKAKVYIPFDGSNSTFIVIDSVNVYMVKTMSLTSPKVTDVEVLRSK